MIMTNYFSFLSETMSQVRVLALLITIVAIDISLRSNRRIIT